MTRNEAMGQGEACLVSRNEPMHDSVPYLRNDLPDETDILHEYFIPRTAFVPFVDGLRAASSREERANLLNASVRVVHREDVALTLCAGRRHARGGALSQPDDRRARARERDGAADQRLIDL